MNFHQDCPHCGHRVTAYTLAFSRPLALAFLKFADTCIRLGRPVDKGEMGLTPQQYSNAQNLKHFGIMAQLEKGRAWEFTKLGLAFLAGKELILTPAAHLGGETLEEQHLAWATHPHKRELVSLRDVLPAEWRTRSEYQEEKRDAVA